MLSNHDELRGRPTASQRGVGGGDVRGPDEAPWPLLAGALNELNEARHPGAHCQHSSWSSFAIARPTNYFQPPFCGSLLLMDDGIGGKRAVPLDALAFFKVVVLGLVPLQLLRSSVPGFGKLKLMFSQPDCQQSSRTFVPIRLGQLPCCFLFLHDPQHFICPTRLVSRL